MDVREQIASQTEMILLYLQTHGAITPLDALREFGCMRLGAPLLGPEKARRSHCHHHKGK